MPISFLNSPATATTTTLVPALHNANSITNDNQVSHNNADQSNASISNTNRNTDESNKTAPPATILAKIKLLTTRKLKRFTNHSNCGAQLWISKRTFIVINKIVHPTKWSIKCHSDKSISILSSDSDAYKAITKSLTLIKVPFHTWQLKEERAFRIVTTHHVTLSRMRPLGKALPYLATVHFINRSKSCSDKPKFLNLVIVGLELASNNMEIHEHKTLSPWDSRRTSTQKDDVVQCHRYQSFNHTKNNCHKDVVCARCGQ